jgi:hypothetical protein
MYEGQKESEFSWEVVYETVNMDNVSLYDSWTIFFLDTIHEEWRHLYCRMNFPMSCQ